MCLWIRGSNPARPIHRVLRGTGRLAHANTSNRSNLPPAMRDRPLGILGRRTAALLTKREPFVQSKLVGSGREYPQKR